MKRILVLWINWMLWNCLFSYLWNNDNILVYWTTKKKENNNIFSLNIDENYLDNLWKLFDENNFDYVINCIAINKFNKNDINLIKKVFIINSHFPKNLDKLSSKYNFKLIHFSTNWIFSWNKWNYSSEDLSDNYDFYWLSKYLWEFGSNKNLIIRTSIIWYDKKGKSENLLNWFLSNKKWKEVNWYSNVYWNWLTTLTIAKILEEIIINNLNINWIIQLSGKKISKYNLLLLFNTIFNKKLLIIKDNSIISDNTIIKTKKQELFKDIIYSLEKQIIQLKEFYRL